MGEKMSNFGDKMLNWNELSYEWVYGAMRLIM